MLALNPIDNIKQKGNFKGFNAFNSFKGNIQENNLVSSPAKDTVSFGNKLAPVDEKALEILNKCFVNFNFKKISDEFVSKKPVFLQDSDIIQNHLNLLKEINLIMLTKIEDLPTFLENAKQYSVLERLHFWGNEPPFSLCQNADGNFLASPVSFMIMKELPVKRSWMSEKVVQTLEDGMKNRKTMKVTAGNKTYAIKGMRTDPDDLSSPLSEITITEAKKRPTNL